MKKSKATCFLISLFLGLYGLLSPSQVRAEIPKRVSIINLIATPEKYHNKKVLVHGFATLKFEGNAIYASRADAEYGISTNALWLQYDDAEEEKYLDHFKNSYAYVRIQGTFDATGHGHLGMFSGTIKEITRFERLKKRPIEEMLRERHELLEVRSKESEEKEGEEQEKEKD
jgi:hypothetical protein